MADILLTAALDFSQALTVQVPQAAKQVEAHFNRLRIGQNIGSNFSRPLGEITGKTSEFTKSLAAANARVIAFGASAGVIYAVNKAFSELVKSSVQVERALTDININLNASRDTLKQFGEELFNISRSTAQSFDKVAGAAAEFARQGLSLSETTKRTRDAMVLSRLANIEASESVDVLTASINSFSKAALDSTEIVNKLAKVDANFAVSTRDLAEGIKRVGSSAQDANVDIDQLIGLITSAQQTTARGGAVIGNALKTIFARIQDNDTIEKLRELGVAIESSQTGLQKLQTISGAIKSLSGEQATEVKKLAGGVYQYNILSATLDDLAKKYNTVERATRDANTATNEALVKNEQLNTTLDAIAKRALTNLTKIGSDIGEASVNPAFKKLLANFNSVAESENTSDIGGAIGKGIIEGIGNFISGPGVVIVGTLLARITAKFTKDIVGAFKSVSELNVAKEQELQIQGLISDQLSKTPEVLQRILSGELSILEVKQKALALARESIALQEASAKAAPGVLNYLNNSGITIGQNPQGEQGFIKKTNRFGIPNFADASKSYTEAISDAISKEKAHISGGVQVKVGRSSRLTSQDNPLGLGVYNTKDEPLGLEQGISRAMREGRDPRKYGGGNIPSFANYYKTIPSSLPDPFDREPGTTILSDAERKSLEAEIEKLKTQIKTGTVDQAYLNKQIESLGKTFELTDNSLQQVARRLTASLGRVEVSRKTSGSSLAALTGELYDPTYYGRSLKKSFGKQLGFDFTDVQQQKQPAAVSQGEFIGIVNQIKTANALNEQDKYQSKLSTIAASLFLNQNSTRVGYVRQNELGRIQDSISGGSGPLQSSSLKDKLLDNKIRNIISSTLSGNPNSLFEDLSSRGFNTKGLGADSALRLFLNSIQGGNKYQIPTLKGFDSHVAAYEANNLRNLTEQASSVFRGDSVKKLQSLGAQGADALAYANSVRASKLQNVGLATSIVAPVLGNIAKEYIGDRTPQSRGFGALASGLGNIASFASIGSLFGSPLIGGAIGGTLGAAAVIPDVIKAFSDTLPDLQRNLEQITEKVNKSRDAFSQFSQTYQIIQDAESGKINVSSRRLSRLRGENDTRITDIGFGSDDRLNLRKALSSGGLEAFRDEFEKQDTRNTNQRLIEQINTSLQDTLFTNRKNYFTSFTSSGDKAGFLENLISPLLPKKAQNIDVLNSAGSGRLNSILALSEGISSEKNKNIFDILKDDLRSGGTVTQSLDNSKNARDFFATLRDASSKGGNRSLSRFYDNLLSGSEEELNSLFSKAKGRYTTSNITKENAYDDKDAERKSQLREVIDSFITNLHKTTISLNENIFALEKSVSLQNIENTNRANISSQRAQGALNFAGNFLQPEDVLARQRSLDISKSRSELELKVSSLTSGSGVTEQKIISDAFNSIYKTRIQQVIDKYGNSSGGEAQKEIDKVKEEFFGENSKSPLSQKNLLSGGAAGLENVITELERRSRVGQSPEFNSRAAEVARDALVNISANRAGTGKAVAEAKLLNAGETAAIIQKAIEENNQNNLRRVIGVGGGLGSGLDASNVLGGVQNSIVGLFGSSSDKTQALLSLTEGLQKFNPKANPFQDSIVSGQTNALVQNAALYGADLDPEEARKIAQIQYREKFKLGPVSPEESNAVSESLNRISTKSAEALKKLADAARENDFAGAARAIEDLQKKIIALGTNSKLTSLAVEKQALQYKLGEGFSGEKAIALSSLDNELLSSRLGNRVDSITLDEKLRRGAVLSGDYANQKLGLRVNQITQDPSNFALGASSRGAFFDQFKYGVNDFYADVVKGAASTGSAIKQGLGDALTSFIDGTKKADEAFAGFGISVAKKLLDITTNIAVSSAFSGLFNILGVDSNSGVLGSFAKALGGTATKSGGGLINGYSSGGYVSGGSGVRDDVPALLSHGEYVIKKSAAQRLGKGRLDKLNKGFEPSVVTRSDSNGFAARFANDFIIRRGGGRNTPNGAYAFDPRLSIIALTDENNPQNQRRIQKEEALINYKKRYRDYRVLLSNYNNAQEQRRLGAYISAVVNIGGGALNTKFDTGQGTSGAVDSNTNTNDINNPYYNPKSQYAAAGGLIRGYSGGGKVFGAEAPSDRVPAMLTGGEYVFKKSAVDRLGVNFLNGLNGGRVNYAEGGLVGQDVASRAANDMSGIADVISKLASAADSLRDSVSKLSNDSNRKSSDKQSGSVVNNVAIHVTVQKDGNATTTKDTQNTNGSSEDERQARALTERMKTVALQVLQEQLRPGGRLDKVK